MTSEEKIWLLISRSVSGEISADEVDELELIFQARPELRAEHENIRNLKTMAPGGFSMAERRAMERGLEKFDEALNNERGFAEKPLIYHGRLDPLQRNTRKSWMIAASVIILLMTGIWVKFYTGHTDKPIQQQAIVTPNGKRVHTILPDGSSVWLNAASSIKFVSNQNNLGKREVFLTGEAYFDVIHDAQHPFIVHAGKLNVVVLGTAFNVKAYNGEQFVETTLIRGKVEILNENAPATHIVMYPNQKITINTIKNTAKKILLINKATVKDSMIVSTPASVALPDTAIDETAWLSNRLSFKQKSFEEIAVQLERWYNVSIVFDNNKYTRKKFTGTFKNQAINEVIHAFQYTEPFHYSITNNQIHIW
jgi:transmembrane sensor